MPGYHTEKTNKQKKSRASGKIKVLQKFHTNLREAVKSKRRKNPSYDPIWGCWLPANRYQVPLPFVNNQETTYADKGSSSVWIAQPGSGFDKRQSTLQLCVRPEGDQTVKPAIVFRGTGLRIGEDERQMYDDCVDVYFQNQDVNIQWTKRTFLPNIPDKTKENALLCDNVNFQFSKEFHSLCRNEGNTVVYLLPDNQTDKVQPIEQIRSGENENEVNESG